MPLRQLVHRMPVLHHAGPALGEGEAPTEPRVVTHVILQVTQFGPQCIWIHVMSDIRSDLARDGEGGGGASQCLLGSAAAAFPMRFAPYVSEIPLIDSGDGEQVIPHEGTGGEGNMVLKSSASPSTSFARSLASRLTRKFQHSHSASSTTDGGVAFTVCCGIAPQWEKLLLGAAATSGPSPTVVEFGGQVYREITRMIQSLISQG